MTTLPDSAQCRSVLADGRVLTITATRRPRAHRADVKCAVPGAPAIVERMREVVRLARHTEARFDSRDQIVLSMDLAPTALERDWELAAVLADRIVRGAYRQADDASTLFALGWSDAWHLGKVDGRPAQAVERLRPHRAAAGCVILGDDKADGDGDGDGGGERDGASLYLSHLGGLTGHTDPSASVSTARAWFPLHSGGINDSLNWVEVSVHPLAAIAAGEEEEDTIAAPELDAAAQLAVRQALAGARHFDGRGLGRWRTVVRFGQPRFQGSSYELALVMADRLARGREFVPRGRVIASGCSSAWHAGRVDSVEGRDAKLILILKQAGRGDRVLLPLAWQADLPADFAPSLRARGATLACIGQIGVI
ncbi:hypothetical protein [Rugamonas sp.]|uniref:hypothetical protein n=1 Tax=Rugamonas sp. TaxID=1926287 RepID=UPI0025E36045|nr:hypothetical protein [Rugamonas sp.]